MNAEPKRLWLEALRSGEFEQTTDSLRDQRGHCCLGVACEVYRRATAKGEWSQGMFRVGRDGSSAELPRPVMEWIGVDSSSVNLPFGGTLSGLNDNGHTFAEIADIIEKEL